MFRKIRVFVIAIVLCCTSLGACSKEAPRTLDEFMESMVGHFGPSIPFEKEYRGVGFSVEGATSKGASFRYENRYDVTAYYGAGWDLFVSTDSGYRYVDIKKRNFAFHDALFPEPYFEHLDFKGLYKGLKPGSYRILLHLKFPQDNGKHNPYDMVYLYADFVISK